MSTGTEYQSEELSAGMSRSNIFTRSSGSDQENDIKKGLQAIKCRSFFCHFKNSSIIPETILLYHPLYRVFCFMVNLPLRGIGSPEVTNRNKNLDDGIGISKMHFSGIVSVCDLVVLLFCNNHHYLCPFRHVL